MKNPSHSLWMTQTAVCLALLVVLQAATMPLGSTLITGSVVNLLLILSVMLCGVSSGTVVAVLSPVLAKLLGIGPLWSLIPLIVLGNVTLILIWHGIGNQTRIPPLAACILALFAAAFAKSTVLYIGIVQITVPLLHLPAQQAAALSGMFSFPQLITAAVGGGLATVLLPLLRRAFAAKGRE